MISEDNDHGCHGPTIYTREDEDTWIEDTDESMIAKQRSMINPYLLDQRSMINPHLLDQRLMIKKL